MAASFLSVAELPLKESEQITEAVCEEESRVVKVCLVLYKCLLAAFVFAILVLLLVLFTYTQKIAQLNNV